VILLTYINPVYLRFGVGVLLVLYTIYGLARPAFKPMKIGIGPDYRHWHFQRARRWTDRTWRRHLDHLLPVAALDQGSATRGISTRAVRGVCGHFHCDGHHWRRHVGKPSNYMGLACRFCLRGLWSGFRLYGKVDDETFRKAVLILLLLAGLSLIVPALIFRAP